MRRVAVTGIGMIDACGNNPTTCFENVVNDKDFSISPYDVFTPDHDEACRTKSVLIPDINKIEIDSKHRTKFMPRHMLYGLHALEQALDMSKVPMSSKVGVFLSKLSHNEGDHEAAITSKISPLRALNVPNDALASYVSQYYKFTGQNVALNAACATGLATIDFGMRVIDNYDFVVVGGSDSGINHMDIGLFSYLKALGSKSMPFDENRDGFIMGEGSGVLILESEQKAKNRGANILAWLYEPGHASDAFNRTSPSGEGAKSSMLDAIYAGDFPDVVNAHGTSTPIGDKVEHECITEITPNTPIYSVKGKIGHTLAAAGILETIYSIKSMKEGIIPPCHNTRVPAFDVITKPTRGDFNRTLNNSFGFGGKCISQIIEIVK